MVQIVNPQGYWITFTTLLQMTLDTDIDATTPTMAKTEKPNLSFVALITMAIESSPNKMCQLSDIYRFISSNFPHYKMDNRKWQNSIRHSLSFNDCFVRIRYKELLSKFQKSVSRGDYWTVHQDAKGMFNSGGYLRRHKKFVDQKKNQLPRFNNKSCSDKLDCQSIGSSIETRESITTSCDTFDQVDYNSAIRPTEVLTNGLEFYPHGSLYQNMVMNYSNPYWEPIEPLGETFNPYHNNFTTIMDNSLTYFDLSK